MQISNPPSRPRMRCIPTVRAQLHAVIERALMLLNELDGDPEAEPSLCDREVSMGNDQDRESKDDNGVADQGGLA